MIYNNDKILRVYDIMTFTKYKYTHIYIKFNWF